MSDVVALDRSRILALLEQLNDELAAESVHGVLHLVGGAVMCLVYEARRSTRDVDGLFQPTRKVREAAARVAARNELDAGWLNDAVKGYLSERGEFELFLELGHLRLLCAQPQYLLAMKCLAMRIGEEFQDLDDVRYLLRHIGVESYAQAVEIITQYYDLERFPQKTLYALEELFQGS